MNVSKLWIGVVIVLLLAGCVQKSSPEETAIAYGRALYANDAEALWRLISETDRRHKNEATFRRQQHQLKGFTREAVEQLARHIDAAPQRRRRGRSRHGRPEVPAARRERAGDPGPDARL
jgi:hypothetical protein